MNNLFKKTEKTLYDFKNLDLKIENIELHINRLGYMVKNTTIDGFQLGADGAWVVTTPTVSTTTISNNTISNKKSVGFDELSLSSDTEGYVRPYFNKPCRVVDSIKTLSIAGNDYVKEYTKGNILGQSNTVDTIKDDYYLNLDNKFNRFTATIGMDDYHDETYWEYVEEATQRTGTITVIGDGTVLETKDFKYGDEAVDIDVNIEGCSKLIIRIKINSVKPSGNQVDSYYDILNGQFYYK